MRCLARSFKLLAPSHGMRRIAIRIIVGLFAVTGFATCVVLAIYFVVTPSNDTSQQDCFIADVVEFIDSATVGDKQYEMVMVTTGFQDKVSFLKLFEKGVRFDSCGQPDRPVLDSVDLYYGPEQGPLTQWPESIVVSEQRISVEYTNEQSDALPVIDIQVRWRK